MFVADEPVTKQDLLNAVANLKGYVDERSEKVETRLLSAVVEIIRRARELPFDSGPIADEDIGEAGKAMFALLDQEENAARAAMRGEFEVPEDWD